jgi:hypothetical protein
MNANMHDNTALYRKRELKRACHIGGVPGITHLQGLLLLLADWMEAWETMQELR